MSTGISDSHQSNLSNLLERSPEERFKSVIPAGLVTSGIEKHTKYIERVSPREDSSRGSSPLSSRFRLHNTPDSSPRQSASSSYTLKLSPRLTVPMTHNKFTLGDSPRSEFSYSEKSEDTPRCVTTSIPLEKFVRIVSPSPNLSTSESYDLSEEEFSQTQKQNRKKGSSVIKGCQRAFATLRGSFSSESRQTQRSQPLPSLDQMTYIEPTTSIIPIYSIRSTMDTVESSLKFKNPYEQDLVHIYRTIYSRDLHGNEICSDPNRFLILNHEGILTWTDPIEIPVRNNSTTHPYRIFDELFFTQMYSAFVHILNVFKSSIDLNFTRILEESFCYKCDASNRYEMFSKVYEKHLLQITEKLLNSESGKWLLKNSDSFQQFVIQFFCDVYYNEPLKIGNQMSKFIMRHSNELEFLMNQAEWKENYDKKHGAASSSYKTKRKSHSFLPDHLLFKDTSKLCTRYNNEILQIRSDVESYITQRKMRRTKKSELLQSLHEHHYAQLLQEVGRPMTRAISHRRMKFAFTLKKLLKESVKTYYQPNDRSVYMERIDQAVGEVVLNWELLNLLVKDIAADPLQKQRREGRCSLPRS